MKTIHPVKRLNEFEKKSAKWHVKFWNFFYLNPEIAPLSSTSFSALHDDGFLVNYKFGLSMWWYLNSLISEGKTSGNWYKTSIHSFFESLFFCIFVKSLETCVYIDVYIFIYSFILTLHDIQFSIFAIFCNWFQNLYNDIFKCLFQSCNRYQIFL